MSTGEVADLDAILAAAEAHDVMTVVDATQAAGWLPLDADRFDFLVAAGYKWLISPRGTAWMTVAPERLDAIVPLAAGWFAGDDVYEAYIGPPLRLAEDARRLDTSPAWFSWVGALPALELLEAVGIDTIHEHNVRVANHFRARMGLEPSNSAIVSIEFPGDIEALRAEGIQCALPGGRLRLGFHLYNDEEDADRAVDVLQVTSPKAFASAARQTARSGRRPYPSPRRRRAPQPARARCAAASRACAAGTSSCHRAASSWPGAGSPGRAWRR